MSTKDLPEPVAAYFAAKNKHDIDGMMAQFNEDAKVKDEGREYCGRAAIRAWVEQTTRKYRVTVAVKEVESATDRDVVSGLVSGNFPGSPVLLRYAFTRSGTKIVRLEIAS